MSISVLPLHYDDWAPASTMPEAVEAEDAPVTVLDWAERYRRPESRPFTLQRFGPLKALYEDDHPHICVIKPAQRGVSEYAINRTCFALELGAARWQTGKNGLNVAYLFPTQSALTDFSKERLTGLRQESSHLARLFDPQGFGGVTFKQVGQSYLYLRGAWSESSLLSFACDVLVLDEFDRMDPKAVALARRRMNASPLRHELDISTPTLPGRGIDALYKQSDQRKYRQACPLCGAENTYDFFRDVYVGALGYDEWKLLAEADIDEMGATLHCPTCRQELDDTARCLPGRWEAENPRARSLRGYWIPSLAFPMADLARLARAAISTDPHQITEFFRSDLGLPYDAAGARITATMLAQLHLDLPGGELPAPMRWKNTTMGVDVGGKFHFRVSSENDKGERYVRAMGEVSSWDELTNLMRRYQVRRCVIDALPELHGCKTWADASKGRVLRAFYPAPGSLGGQLARLDEKKGTVHIDRTMAMDGVYDTVASAREHWPASVCRSPQVIAHLTAPVRTLVVDDTGQPRASWEHTTPDHLFHACVYDRIARVVLSSARASALHPIFAQAAAAGWGGGQP